MANFFSKIAGTIATKFKIGLGANAVHVKNNSGVVEARNADDSGYVVARAADAVGQSDLVTKKQLDRSGNFIISRQADCSSAIPSNTGSAGFVVVTEAGNGAVIGNLLYDNGSSTGTMEIIAAAARSVLCTVALSGNTETFDADSLYIWDVEGDTWVKSGDIGSVTGAERVIDFEIDNSAQQDSDSQIPAGSVVYSCAIFVTTPYSASATATVGNTTTADLLMVAGDSYLQSADSYEVPQRTAWATASVVRMTVANSPAAGAGRLVVKYSVPNA